MLEIAAGIIVASAVVYVASIVLAPVWIVIASLFE